MAEPKLNKDGIEAGKLLSPKEYQKAFAASQAKARKEAQKAKK